MSRLSVNNSIADLSIERMSLTNSVKSLSLDESDWDLLASINQRMNGGPTTKENAVVVDPVAFNARVNSGMQMSELMKVGWELRPQALGVESRGGNSQAQSRAGSAGSTSSFRLGLGLTGVMSSKIKNRKEEPPIVERPKAAIELTIDGKHLDNLPSLPRKPTKPATNKKAGKGSAGGGHRGRKVKRTESPTKRQRGNGAVSPRQYVNIFDNISHNF